jgi:hypothetical protein
VDGSKIPVLRLDTDTVPKLSAPCFVNRLKPSQFGLLPLNITRIRVSFVSNTSLNITMLVGATVRRPKVLSNSAEA